MATPRNKQSSWETDLIRTTVHELGHAAVIEALGMECRRIAVEVNPNHKPGDAYWIGHTSNRQANQETPDEAILINIAGVVAEGLYGIPRITAFQAALLLDKNRHIQECNGAWSDAHVKKALRLLRGVWPSLLAEAGTWSAEQLINHPAPNSPDCNLVTLAKDLRVLRKGETVEGSYYAVYKENRKGRLVAIYGVGTNDTEAWGNVDRWMASENYHNMVQVKCTQALYDYVLTLGGYDSKNTAMAYERPDGVLDTRQHLLAEVEDIKAKERIDYLGDCHE